MILSAGKNGFAQATDPVVWSGNGHAYQFVVDDGIDWPEARLAAEQLELDGVPGYLATVTSMEENDFLRELLIQAELDLQMTQLVEAWLGAEQLDPTAPPDETWAWITGEPFQYTNWDPGEPNDVPVPEHYLGMWGTDGDGAVGTWNDQGGAATANNIDGYLVEYNLIKGQLGDVNCDGEVNLLDVQPFIDLLTSGEYLDKADINQDGSVDLLDVDPFVDLLTGG